MAQEGNRSNVGRTLVHQPICLQFRRWGNCRFGEKCRYVHTTGRSTYGPPQGVGRDQRYLQAGEGEQRETTAITIGTAGNEVKNKSYSGNVEPKRSVDFHRNPKMKTRLCIRWERDGRCPYGSRCQFAHGKRELRVVGHSNALVSLSSAAISAPAENVASYEIGSSAGISAPAENVASIETGSSAGISAPAENVAPNATGSSAGISAPVENVASSETGSRAPSKLRFKWNDVHKINKIYGDWIE